MQFKRKPNVKYAYNSTFKAKPCQLKRSSLNKQSVKRKKADKANHDATIAKCGGLCQICRINPATDHHHLIPRSWALSGGIENRDNLDNFIGVCRGCHQWIHADRKHVIATAARFGIKDLH